MRRLLTLPWLYKVAVFLGLASSESQTVSGETYPALIPDDEVVIRAIFSPFHVRKGRLVWQAYDPTPGTNEISMMRVEILGADGAKAQALKIGDPPKKIFRGFGVLNARDIREGGHDVLDSRIEYLGHAHIALNFPFLTRQIPAEPLDPADSKMLRDALNELVRRSQYFVDPKPEGPDWSGPELSA